MPWMLVYRNTFQRYLWSIGLCGITSLKTIVLILAAVTISNQDVRNLCLDSYSTSFMSTFNLKKIGSVWHNWHLEKLLILTQSVDRDSLRAFISDVPGFTKLGSLSFCFCSWSCNVSAFVTSVIKDEVHPITCHEGTEGEQRYSSTPSLTSVLDGGGWLMLLWPLYPWEWHTPIV
jgi:hypothetical protein